MIGCAAEDFEHYGVYHGADFGAVWSPEGTRFRVWAPTALAVRVNLYRSGDPLAEDRLATLDMAPDAEGTWVAWVEGALHGVYYTYTVTHPGGTAEVCDPYARAVGVNGQRGMVVNLAETAPEGWQEDRPPHAGKSITDAVIYELHLRDISVNPGSGIREKGRYAGLTERGTTTPGGIPTGLEHILGLGVTHVQLMPIFDFGSVEERPGGAEGYNWGYDPVNFNAPEGSYSRDPAQGQVRVREVKELVAGLHRAGLGVVMDVVYNHVYDAERFSFNRLVPGYFSRQRPDGTLTNDSGCGNDTASERPMVRKFIVDSLCYWAEEYHLDGFRMDLAGLLDVPTIREAMAAVRRRCPHVLFYGEGWDMCTAPVCARLPMAVQANARLVPQFGFFRDGIRDLLRGSVFFPDEPGFVTGDLRGKEALLECYRGDDQSVNYVSCHDNHTLFDRITTAIPGADFRERVRRNLLAAAFTLTARGAAFFQAGEEMLRTKPDGAGGYEHNSYRSGDGVNAIRWENLENPAYGAVCSYYRGLIALRHARPIFRRGRDEELQLVGTPSPRCVAFRVGEDGLAIFNAGEEAITLSLEPGLWEVFVDGERAGDKPFDACRDMVTVPPISAKILFRREEDGMNWPEG